MKKILNEYGLIAILLIVSVGGYLALGDQKEDFLSDPLDAIGARFANLMADDASKAEMSESFAVFRQKMVDKEISPEQFESVAASVLNLEASGEQITWEEANMVLSLVSEPTQMVIPDPGWDPLASSAPSAPSAASPPGNRSDPDLSLPNPASGSAGGVLYTSNDFSPERYKVMNERLADAFAFADGMDAMAKKNSGRGSLRSYVQFEYRNGISVVVDSNAFQMWNDQEMQGLTREIERNRMVRFRKGAGGEYRRREALYNEQRKLAAMERSLDIKSNVQNEYLVALERLQKLQSLGMVVEFDTVHVREALDLGIEMMMHELGDLRIEFDLEADEDGHNNSDAEADKRSETIRIKVNSN